MDALEKQFMQEGGVASEDYLKFMSEESGNVDASGMFSIQVSHSNDASPASRAKYVFRASSWDECQRP